jgi:hypothetical protein
MQWYCVEHARSFNDLSAVIANGDYLHGTHFPNQYSSMFIVSKSAPETVLRIEAELEHRNLLLWKVHSVSNESMSHGKAFQIVT